MDEKLNKDKLKDVILWGVIFFLVVILSIGSFIYTKNKDKELDVDSSTDLSSEEIITTEDLLQEDKSESLIEENTTERIIDNSTNDSEVEINLTESSGQISEDSNDEQLYTGEENQ